MTAAAMVGRAASARTKTRPPRAWLGAGTVVALLVAWELLSVSGALPEQSIPSARAVLHALVAELPSGRLWSALWHTVSIAIAGLVVIAVIALPCAVLIGRVPWIRDSTWFVIEFLKPIPPVALIPLGLLLWGPSERMKLFLVVFGAFWPLLVQLVYGVRSVDGVTLEMARSYRLGWWRTTTRVVAPALLPYALTGLRISASIAIVVAVVTEMIGGAAGLGQSITVAQSAAALPEMYALIIVTGLLGLAVNAFFRILERPLLFWHASQREKGN